MSETTSHQSPTDSPATQPADAGPHAVPETVAATSEASAPQTKRKRKRKRKRKGALTTGEGTTAPAEAVGASSSEVSAAAAPSHGRKQPAQGPKGGHKDNGHRASKRRPEPMHKHHRRDAERGLRTQEQLASWRWIPTGGQLSYFPVVNPPVGTVAPEAPIEPSQVDSPAAPISVDAGGVTAADEAAGLTAAADEAAGLTAAADEPAGLTAAADEPAGATALLNDAAGAGMTSESMVTDGVVGAQTAGAEKPTEGEAPNNEPPPDAPHADVASPALQKSHHGGPRASDAGSPRWSIPSDSQLAPWLTEVLARCPEAERASLVVSLCSHRAFRQRVGQLEQPELRPLVAVYDAVFLDAAPSVATMAATSEQPQSTSVDAREELRRGLEAVSRGAVSILRSWPLPARERLSELAEGFELDSAIQRDAARLFYDAPKLVGRLGLRSVCDALSQGQDAAAKELIKAIGSQPGVPGLLPMLTEALEGQRFGSLVILSYGGAQSRGPDPKAPKRHSGFCLESQRDVWIRTGESTEAAAFEHYSQVHRRALLPGVVGLYSFGVTRSRKPYAAVLRKGISLQRKLDHGWGLPRLGAVSLATELTLLASGLCRAGLRLPDLDARRFELDDEGRVWLSDLWGAELVEARAQDTTSVSVCRDAVVHLLANQPGFTLPEDWREVLSYSADFETIVATLRKLEKSRFWSS